MPYLIDTCIWVDFFRGNEAAVAFIKGLKHQPYSSLLIVGELFAGAKGERENKQISRLTEHCKIIPLSLPIVKQGGMLRAKYRPTHGTGFIDALIAASALETECTLATLNEKHFPMLDIFRPY